MQCSETLADAAPRPAGSTRSASRTPGENSPFQSSKFLTDSKTRAPKPAAGMS